jgi:exodeoxyribonuclease X
VAVKTRQSRVNQILVVDTEVTGLDPEKDVPVEVATVLLSRSRGSARWQISDLWHTLVNPGDVPISFGAMGTHHITPDMVDYAPIIDAAVPKKHLLRDHKVVRAAHVAKFDRNHVEKFFPKTRWICTYKCARMLWPDEESYSNQALRYARAVDVAPYGLSGLGAHRALFDAVVSAELLVQMLAEKEPEELIDVSCKPILLKEMRFGEHKGKPFSEVPASYMRWIVSKGVERMQNGRKVGFSEDVVHTCQHWLDKQDF